MNHLNSETYQQFHCLLRDLGNFHFMWTSLWSHICFLFFFFSLVQLENISFVKLQSKLEKPELISQFENFLKILYMFEKLFNLLCLIVFLGTHLFCS